MSKNPQLPFQYLNSFVLEDSPFGDITTIATGISGVADASVVLKEPAVIAGIDEATSIFNKYSIEISESRRDGERVKANKTIMRLTGSVDSILLLERTVLNIMGRMSGISTITSELQEIIYEVNPDCKVAATRKTAPGLRILDKKAVIIGGGEPHRYSLSDCILIKDNHLAVLPLKELITNARSFSVYKTIEVEITIPSDAVKAAQYGADIILLDNMSPGKVSETIKLLNSCSLRNSVRLEVSGNITRANIREYAALDIDIISLGALTHSVKNIDISLKITSVC